MIAGLVALAARRALAPGVLAILAAVLVLALRADWGGAGGGAEHARASTREAAGSILLLAIVPLLLVRAARTVGAWRSGEGDWLGSRAAGRRTILVSTWIGTWIGGAIVLAIAFAAIELSVGSLGSGARSLRRSGEIALPKPAWIEPGSPSAWTTGEDESDWPEGARARVELAFGAGSGASAEISLRARRDSPPGERLASARIASRGTVEVEIPPGTGPLSFEIACERPGARAYVASDAMEVWEPGARESAAGLEIFLRLALALGAWTALAIGLGAWMRPATAVLALLAAWIPAWLADRAPPWLPAADLWTALATAGEGRVPEAPDPRALAVLAALAALGVAIGAASLSRWRAAA